MEHIPIAQAFLKQHMPTHLQQDLDLSSLVRVDRTHTDSQLKQRHKDIIYKASLREYGDLLACLEHQSEDDSMMPVRYLRYGADGLEAYLEEGHKKWPVIVSLLFYHGEKSPYPHGSHAAGYYRYPQWGIQELWMRFHVIDVGQLSDEDVLRHGICAPMELLLKHSRSGNFELEAVAYRAVFQECVAAVGDDYVTTLLTYAIGLSDAAVGERIFVFIEEVLTDKKDIIMTYGQKLEERGMQQEKLSIAKNMLFELHLGEDIIQKATGLSGEELARLQVASEE